MLVLALAGSAVLQQLWFTQTSGVDGPRDCELGATQAPAEPVADSGLMVYQQSDQLSQVKEPSRQAALEVPRDSVGALIMIKLME